MIQADHIGSMVRDNCEFLEDRKYIISLEKLYIKKRFWKFELHISNLIHENKWQIDCNKTTKMKSYLKNDFIFTKA